MFSILYVDDEPGLLEIGKLFLEQDGRYSVETVTSARQALEILRTGQYDAIISDYQMPLMDGIEFLKQVRAQGSKVPFIIFTGRGREEIVIQALNEGADFYLQKGGEPVSQFAELGHKLQTAILQRSAEASIRDHERREADIINFLPDATFAIDTRGIVIAWNRAMEKMTGVRSSEILGKDQYEYALPFYHERRPILIDLVLNDNPSVDVRYPYIKRDGNTLFSEITIPHFNNGGGAALWFTASPLYGTGGNVVGAIESIREITEWKRTEEALNESEKRFREFSDLLPQVVYEVDIEGSLKYANHIAFEVFGYTEEEFRQGLSVLQMLAPRDRERAAEAFSSLYKGTAKIGAANEYEALRKDGSTFPVSIYSSPVIVNGRITGLRGIIVDITERKKAEDAIRESEQKYRTVFETTGTAMVLIENDGTISLANSEFERLSGLSKDGIEGRKKWTEFVVQEDLDRMVGQHRMRRENREHALSHYEFRFRQRSGEVRDIYLTIDIIPGTTKSVASLLDITERKQVENRLIIANQEYTNLLDQIQDVYYRSDAEGRLVKASRSLTTLLGYDDLSECLGRNIADGFYFNPADRQKFSEEVYRNGKVTDYEVQLKKKDGTPVLVATSSHLSYDAAGTVNGIEGTFRDITVRRQQEHILRIQLDLGLRLQTLRGREEILDACLVAAIDISGLDSGGIYLVDEPGGSVDLILSRNLGEEFIPTISHYASGSANAQMVMAGKPVYIQFSKSGIAHTPVQEREGLRALAIIPAHSRGRVIACLNIASHTVDEIPGEARIALETIATQIGAAIERARTDEALEASEERYRNVIEDQTEFISRFLPDGTHVFVNDAYCRYFGLTRDEMLGHHFRPKIPPEDREKMKRFFESLTPDHPVDIIEHRIIMPDGSVRWQRWSDRAIFDSGGTVTEYQSVGRDITDKKEAEIALQVSEDRFRRIADNAQDMIYRMSLPEGKYEYISRGCIRLTGYTPEEFYADPGIIRRLIHPDWQEYFRQQWSAMLEGNVPPFYEFQIIDRSGSMHWVNQRNVLVTGEQGEPEAIEGIVTDITDRRKTEEALKESESHLRLITDNTVDQISQIDRNRIILSISQSVERLMGFQPSDLIGQKVTDYIHPDDLERVIGETRAVIDQKGPSIRLEYRYRHRNGEYRWFESESRILYSDAGEYDGAVFVSRDITDRRLVEEQLRESRERFQKIFEDSPLGIAIVSPAFTFRMVNRRFCGMLQYTEDELLNKSFTDITHPDHLAVDRVEVRKLFAGERDVYKTEKKYIKKDGSLLWGSLTASPVKHTNGSVLYAIALIEDITDRRLAEEALQVAQEKYTKAFHSVPDAMTISELDSGRFIEVNEAATALFGYTRDELIGKCASDLGIWMKKEDRDTFIDQLAQKGRIKEYEVLERRKSGKVYNAMINADTLTMGGRHYLVAVIRDITERKRAEQFIREANRKINLLTSITRHDVANQVSILKGFARIALMKKPDPVMADLIQKIDMAGSTIARQIEFTKSYQELGMQAPGWQKIRDIMAQQNAEGISLSCTCDAEIFADPMLERVFFNLIDNAVRHGETVAAITVSCRPSPEGLVIVVGDDGIGVPPELKEKIFEKGFGKHTGFGLFLAREILAITGITIREKGTPGKGAMFEITVPEGTYRIA